MPAPRPLAAFDVHDDGHTEAVDDTGTTPARGAVYRWLHFDLADPALAEWTAAHLPTEAAGALLQPETRPRCDTLDTGIILNLRGVNLNPGAETEDMVSLRIWVGDAIVVTARRRKIFAVDALRQTMADGTGPNAIGGFLSTLTTGLVERIESAILDEEDRTDTLELAIFAEEDTDDDLPQLRLKLIKLHRFLTPQRDALFRLSEATRLDPITRIRLREEANRAARSSETLTALTERVKALSDHLHMRNAETTGRNGMILSIVASIFLPLGFITGLFGVNLAGIPWSQNPLAFAGLAVVCLAIAVLLLLIFRLLRWF